MGVIVVRQLHFPSMLEQSAAIGQHGSVLPDVGSDVLQRSLFWCSLRPLVPRYPFRPISCRFPGNRTRLFSFLQCQFWIAGRKSSTDLVPLHLHPVSKVQPSDPRATMPKIQQSWNKRDRAAFKWKLDLTSQSQITFSSPLTKLHAYVQSSEFLAS